MMESGCDFGKLFHWLALNADIRNFVLKFPVRKPRIKEWDFFLEVLTSAQADIPSPETLKHVKAYSHKHQDKGQ